MLKMGARISSKFLEGWLPLLSMRRKWNKKQRHFKVSDILLVISPDTPRENWLLGKVTKKY